jgi:hypothetical protein
MSHRRCAGSCDRREINRLHLPAPTAIAIQANDNLPSTRCRLPVTSRASVQRSTVRRSRRSVPGRLRTSWLRPAAMPDARVASAFAAHGSSLQPLQPISRRHHRDASNPGPRWSHPRGRPRTSWGMAACAFARRPVTAAAVFPQSSSNSRLTTARRARVQLRLHMERGPVCSCSHQWSPLREAG